MTVATVVGGGRYYDCFQAVVSCPPVQDYLYVVKLRTDTVRRRER